MVRDRSGQRHRRHVEHVIEVVLGARRRGPHGDILPPVRGAPGGVHVDWVVETLLRSEAGVERELVRPIARRGRGRAAHLIVSAVECYVECYGVIYRYLLKKRQNPEYEPEGRVFPLLFQVLDVRASHWKHFIRKLIRL